MAASAPEETKRETIMKALGIEAGAGLRSQDRAHDARTLVSSESAASSNVRRWRTLSENLAPLLQDLETLNHKQNHAVVGLWPERRRRIDAKRAATGRVADSIKVFNQALERAERFNNAVGAASAPLDAKQIDPMAVSAGKVLNCFRALTALVSETLQNHNACSPGSRTHAQLYAIACVIQSDVVDDGRFEKAVAEAAPRPSCFSWWHRPVSTELTAATPLMRDGRRH